MDQLALFPDTAVTGSGQPRPWPVTPPEPEVETPAGNPDQLTFEEGDDQ